MMPYMHTYDVGIECAANVSLAAAQSIAYNNNSINAVVASI